MHNPSREPELLFFGASNAAANFGMSGGTRFKAHEILGQLYSPHTKLVRQETGRLTVNLRSEEEIGNLTRDEGRVINTAIAGKNSLVLATHFFEPEVLRYKPIRLFLLPPMNDIRKGAEMMNGESSKGVYPGKIWRALTEDPAHAAENTARLVYGHLDQMITRAIAAEIQPIVSTLPPMGSKLAYQPDNPYHQFLKGTGSEIVLAINELIKQPREGVQVLDLHGAVVDPQTGLMKPEFAWGELDKRWPGERNYKYPDEEDDLFHLNSRGQTMIAAMLAHRLFNKQVTIITPVRDEIVYPSIAA